MVKFSKKDVYKHEKHTKVSSEDYLLKSRVILSIKWQDKEQPRIKGYMYHLVNNGVLSGVRLTGFGPMNSRVFDLLLIDGKLFFYHPNEDVTYILAKNDKISTKPDLNISRIFDEIIELILPREDITFPVECPPSYMATKNNISISECYRSKFNEILYIKSNGFPKYVFSSHAIINYESIDNLGYHYLPKIYEIEFFDLPIFVKFEIKEFSKEDYEKKDQIFSISEFQLKPFVSLASRISEEIQGK